MNQLKISIVFITLFASMVTAQKPFEFQTCMQKDTFLVGEPIEIGVSILNKGNTTQPHPGGVGMQLLNETGIPLRYTGPSGNWFSPSISEIKPGEEVSRIIEITGLWGERYCLINLHSIIAAGKYELQVYYTPPDMQTDTTKVTLQIINPKEDEKIVIDSFVELSMGFHGEAEYVEALRLLHEAHPNSAYTPRILASLGAMYKVGLNEYLKAAAVSKELVEKYPWSIDSQGALEMFLEKMPSSGKRIEYLKKLIPKSKNSPAQKVIELELKKEMEK